MVLSWFDILIFLIFILIVVSVSIFKSRKGKTSEDFFLASRGLTWQLIGISLIAANISTEQFVGMSGQGAGITGFAIASYEWMAAITLIVVAFLVLPKFLKVGIYTIPEFLEYRFNKTARTIMAVYMILTYVAVTVSAVIYSGGLTINTIFDLDLTASIWLIGLVAALYASWGGLKAVAWADLFQGGALLIGGFVVLYLSLNAIGGWGEFMANNHTKMHMILPADHPVLPWTALLVGLWIPNFYYWGLNQYITQRTLAAKSVKEGQRGIVFAAALKLTIPFIIVVPGIIAGQLYASDLSNSDAAYPMLIKHLVPNGLKGFLFAAISGAVISSLASMSNSASTIFTMDIYTQYINKTQDNKKIITVGRITTIAVVVIGCIIAPFLGHPALKGIFTFIQEFQGFISPGVLAAFIFGIFIKKAPKDSGTVALLLNAVMYGMLLLFFSDIAFLNRMAISFGTVILVLTSMTLYKPLPIPVVLPVRKDFDTTTSRSTTIMGVVVIVITLILYAIFW
ncbi:MAG: solute:sodium symporter family transporter [Ignavibacteriae bacterium HGW-Ignavibacteriae-2]|jgi:SSS family solute:Na+ symporter|nr:MAG: solute:sodium symporter family transporter [Ignavibacteriae bacterium HGW-Ignavibacteriae-2]